MPTRNDSPKDRLSRYREIKIEVIGEKSGRAISFPVWFVLDGENLYLLPAYGSQTQWYKNVLKSPSIRINVESAVAELEFVAISDPRQVSSVVEKFRAKYGDNGVKLYSKPDVGVRAAGALNAVRRPLKRRLPQHVGGFAPVFDSLTHAGWSVEAMVKSAVRWNVLGGGHRQPRHNHIMLAAIDSIAVSRQPGLANRLSLGSKFSPPLARHQHQSTQRASVHGATRQGSRLFQHAGKTVQATTRHRDRDSPVSVPARYLLIAMGKQHSRLPDWVAGCNDDQSWVSEPGHGFRAPCTLV